MRVPFMCWRLSGRVWQPDWGRWPRILGRSRRVDENEVDDFPIAIGRLRVIASRLVDYSARSPAVMHALEVIDRRAPQAPPPTSVDERITAAVSDFERPLPFSELRALRRVRIGMLHERLPVLTAEGPLVKSDDGYRLGESLRPPSQRCDGRTRLHTSASRTLYSMGKRWRQTSVHSPTGVRDVLRSCRT
jgi:hypothetical protein